jgi:hypothetical protein
MEREDKSEAKVLETAVIEISEVNALDGLRGSSLLAHA